MARFFKNSEQNKGLASGSLVFIGRKKVDETRIRVMDYTKTSLEEKKLIDLDAAMAYKSASTVTWINIDGLHDTDTVKAVGQFFDLHALVLEDILNTGQRPKFEEFDHFLYIVLKMIRFDDQKQMVSAEQLSMIVGETVVLTFQEQPGDVFDPVRERIRKEGSRIRGEATDYLAHALLDTVVDNYIYTISRIGETIEDNEEEILTTLDTSLMEKIKIFKREINYLRKTVRPAREAIQHLVRSENPLIRRQTRPFLKDLQDLVTQASEAIDTYNDMLSDQLTLFNSAVSNRTNDIMRVLTIFAAIFIPLTFLAGIYGTNFEYMPELHYRYGYFIFLGIMIVIASGLVLFFKRKGWL
ncbi:MAG: magnesium/cobalt transporter CorA [Pseudomonadota bacterium]